MTLWIMIWRCKNIFDQHKTWMKVRCVVIDLSPPPPFLLLFPFTIYSQGNNIFLRRVTVILSSHSTRACCPSHQYCKNSSRNHQRSGNMNLRIDLVCRACTSREVCKAMVEKSFQSSVLVSLICHDRFSLVEMWSLLLEHSLDLVRCREHHILTFPAWFEWSSLPLGSSSEECCLTSYLLNSTPRWPSDHLVFRSKRN
jgi:hypothetical protein